jgi:hypothetical protein
MSFLSATQADGYWLPPEYYDLGQYKTKCKNQFANSKGHNQYFQNWRGAIQIALQGNLPRFLQEIDWTRNAIQYQKYQDRGILLYNSHLEISNGLSQLCTNPQRGFDYVTGMLIQKGQEDSDELKLATDKAAPDALDCLEYVAHGKHQTLTNTEELQRLQTLNATTKLNDANLNTFRPSKVVVKQSVTLLRTETIVASSRIITDIVVCQSHSSIT